MFFEDWGLGIINSIPKVAGSCVIAKLRPIALQAAKKKWLMTILCLQVEQIFQQLTHNRQVGCVKGRQMINHIWGVRSTFEMTERCLMVSFDFSNAFPTLSHTFIQAVLQLIELPIGYVLFVLATLRTPYQFCVGRGVVRDVSYVPKAGIGQGDPFSPVLFSFCVSFVLHFVVVVIVGAPTWCGAKRKRKAEVATVDPIDPGQWLQDARNAGDSEAVAWFVARATNTGADDHIKKRQRLNVDTQRWEQYKTTTDRLANKHAQQARDIYHKAHMEAMARQHLHTLHMGYTNALR